MDVSENFKKGIFYALKKPGVIIFLAVIILIITAIFYFTKESAPKYEIYEIDYGNVYQTISETGVVKPQSAVDLAFEGTGKVTRVYKKVGDSVSAGEILAQIYNADLKAKLAEAQANVKAQQAKLDELKRGTRPEEIQVQEVKVANAKTALNDAKISLIAKLQDAYTKSDDAVRNKVDQFFNNPRSSNPKLFSSINADVQLESNIEWERLRIENTLNAWRSLLEQLNIESDLSAYISQTKANLKQTKLFLDQVSLAVNGLTAHGELTQTTIDGWKSDVSTGRTNVNTATTNLTAAEEKIKTAQSNLTLAEQELSLKKAGSAKEQIQKQEAILEQARASVDNYKAQIAKTALYAPISGIISKMDAKTGEVVSGGSIIASVISKTKFKIEVDIYEEDVPLIQVGNPVDIELVALPQETLKGEVLSIDPAEKIVDGVVYYETQIGFTDKKQGLRAGMSADIEIQTDFRQNVLTIPENAIQKNNNKYFVEILKQDAVEKQEIKIGLEGTNGMVEVLSGLKAKDKVIIR